MWLSRNALPFAALLILLTIWAIWQSNVRVAADAAWLTHAAQEFLAGRSMHAAYFDNNPPMSVLAYVPPALMVNMGLPVWVSLNIYTFALITLSLAATGFLLWRIPDLSPRTRWSALAGYAAAISMLCAVEFAQKDHLIALGIVPFILAQHVWLYRQNDRRLTLICILTFVFATPMILIKPHFGLLCTAMILIRTVRTRRVLSFFAADTIILALGVAVYALAIYVFFPDFMTQILPPSLRLYVASAPMAELRFLMLQKATGGLAAFFLFAALLTYYSVAEKKERIFFLTLIAMGALSLIPFLLQNKGYFLHLIPTYAFTTMVAVMLAADFSKQLLEKYAPEWQFTAIVIICAALIFAIRFPGTPLPPHTHYRETNLVHFLKENARLNGFVVETLSTNVFYQASVYSGAPYATRFPSFWFLDKIVQMSQSDPKPALGYAHQFSDYIIEDLKTYKPNIVMFLSPDQPFSVLLNPYWPDSGKIKQALNGYRFKETMTMRFTDFDVLASQPGPEEAHYDVYIRR